MMAKSLIFFLKRSNKKTRPNLVSGFTLVETLLVIAISALFITIVVFSFSSLLDDSSIQKDVAKIKSVLEESRYLSISEKGDYSYGVHIQSDKVVSFKSVVYDPEDSRNITLSFDEVHIEDISLGGGGNEIIFNKITGSTNNFGSFKIRYSRDPEKIISVKITGTGLVSIE